MKEFLKLIRWPNLLIVIIIQVLFRYAVLAPLVSAINVSLLPSGNMVAMSLQLSTIDFILLVFATVAITAGGYVINDYFDIRTDLINRGEVIVGSRISRRKAMMWHNMLNIAGVAAGVLISWRVGYLWAGIMFLMVSGLLYFYSATYKRQLLIGNLIVSILTAMVPMMVVFFDIAALFRFYSGIVESMPVLKVLWMWGLGYAVFAFLTTFAREIIKDMQDYEGDSAYGSNSLPVVAGIKVSKAATVALLVITMALLMMVWYFFLHDLLTLLYILVILIAPMALLILLIIRAKDTSQFGRASMFLKVIMLAGICYSVLAWFIITKNLFL